MKKESLFIMLMLILPVSSIAQNNSVVGLSIGTDIFPQFQLHEDQYTGSSVYSLQVSFYDKHNTRLQFAIRYSRGYDQSISHSVGLSAAYVIGLSDRFFLNPGIGLDGYKLKDRSCRTSFRSIMNTLFDIYEPCDDDIHASFNPFVEAELQLPEPFSLFFQTSYRLMISSTDYVKETITQAGPNGQEFEREIHGTKNSVYGAGLSLGMGIRINF